MILDRMDPERFEQWRSPDGARRLADLENLRHAAGFEPRLEVCPDKQHGAIAPAATWDHRFKVPPGSYLWALSGSSGQPAGFSLQITDISTRDNLFSGSIKSKTLFSGTAASYADSNKNARSITSPLNLISPARPLLFPGVLNVQITNLDPTNSNTVQVVLWIWQPVNGERNAYNDALDRALGDFAQHAKNTGYVPDEKKPIDPSMLRPATNRPFSLSATGTNIIIPAVPGRRIAVHEISIYNTTEQNIRILDGASDLVGPLLDYGANAFYFLGYQDEPHFVCQDGNAFAIDLSAISGGSVGAINGFCKYRLFLPDFTPGQ